MMQAAKVYKTKGSSASGEKLKPIAKKAKKSFIEAGPLPLVAKGTKRPVNSRETKVLESAPGSDSESLDENDAHSELGVAEADPEDERVSDSDEDVADDSTFRRCITDSLRR
jgi:hypothetical protein